MSFFELDGGAKKRKSTKPKATKKAPAKKASGKGKKKGGNFLGTVSELFAPAGWENFVTAAGLLALDRTDNYLRKSKDSKKQKGGADDTPYEETDTDTMTGGARKRSSSRKQRGGSDGHHTVEYLDAVGGEDDTTSQTGGAKKKTKSKTRSRSSSRSKPKVKKTVRKHKGGAMTDDEKRTFITSYHREPEEAKQLIDIYNSVSSNNSIQNNNQSTRGNKIISKVIETHSQSLAPTPIGNNVTLSMQQQANAQQAAQPAAQPENSLFGGKKSKSKPKSKSSSKKSKSSSKKPKAKKAKGRK